MYVYYLSCKWQPECNAAVIITIIIIITITTVTSYTCAFLVKRAFPAALMLWIIQKNKTDYTCVL